jgi:hypothetical protein
LPLSISHLRLSPPLYSLSSTFHSPAGHQLVSVYEPEPTKPKGLILFARFSPAKCVLKLALSSPNCMDINIQITKARLRMTKAADGPPAGGPVARRPDRPSYGRHHVSNHMDMHGNSWVLVWVGGQGGGVHGYNRKVHGYAWICTDLHESSKMLMCPTVRTGLATPAGGPAARRPDRPLQTVETPVRAVGHISRRLETV